MLQKRRKLLMDRLNETNIDDKLYNEIEEFIFNMEEILEERERELEELKDYFNI